MHKPVLLEEVVAWLEPERGGFFVDAGGEGVDGVEFELREKNRERHSGDDGEMQCGAS